jgi:hypothetical protein
MDLDVVRVAPLAVIFDPFSGCHALDRFVDKITEMEATASYLANDEYIS